MMIEAFWCVLLKPDGGGGLRLCARVRFATYLQRRSIKQLLVLTNILSSTRQSASGG